MFCVSEPLRCSYHTIQCLIYKYIILKKHQIKGFTQDQVKRTPKKRINKTNLPPPSRKMDKLDTSTNKTTNDFCTITLNLGIYIGEEWVVGFFQVTSQNMLLFISCQGILSKFLNIKPNPYYRHFSEGNTFKIIICQAKPKLQPFLCTEGLMLPVLHKFVDV